MAGPSTRETNPQGNATAGTSGASTFLPAIVILLLVGLALRLIIAHVLLPGSGFPNDLGAFRGWSADLVSNGTDGFYDRPGFLDYPPVYLLLLFLQGKVFALFGGIQGDAIKYMPILADLVLAAVVYRMVMELGASRQRALIAATVVILNPITWFNSAIWGQADAVGSVFLLLGLRALLQDRRELASAWAVVATLTKLQLGILGFLVGFVVLRRSLAPRDGEADPARVLTSIASGLGTAALLCLPFTGLDYPGLLDRLARPLTLLTLLGAVVVGAGVFVWARRRQLVEGVDRTLAALALAVPAALVMVGQVFDAIVERMGNTFGEYPWLTLNAYNPWALAESETGSSMAKNMQWIRDVAFTNEEGFTQAPFYFGPFSAGVTAMAVMGALLLVSLAVVAWRWAGSLEEGAPGSRGRSSDLRGVAGMCLAAAGVIAFLVGGQIRGPLPAAIVGEGLLLATIVAVGIWAAWRDDSRSIVVALAILAIAFFVVPTRAHERYLFPFFAVGAILLALSWRWATAYVVLAIANSANLVAVLGQYCGIPSDTPYGCGQAASLGGGSRQLSSLLIDWSSFLRDARFNDYIWPIALSSVVMGLALVWALWQMRGRAVERLAGAGGLEAGAEAGFGGAALPAGEPAAAPSLGEVAWEDEGYYYDEEGEYEVVEYSNERPEFVPQSLLRAWHWLARPSSRPDRSAALNREPRGRFDKMDLWVVVALIAVLLSMRVWRLGEPAQTHFDEVYHARTATEFLQQWRYGTPHDIYEWTHPHLAKYGIAAGINTFSNHKVTATGDLGVPVEDAAIQPRTPPPAPVGEAQESDPRFSSDARLGDRLFVATGIELRVYDLQSRGLEWRYDIPAVAVSMAAESGYLFAGTADGWLWRIDLGSLDDVRLGLLAAPNPPVKLAENTGLQIESIYAGAPPLILAIASNGEIVSVDGKGAIQGRGHIEGAADFIRLGNSPPTLAAIPAKLGDIEAEASILAEAVGTDRTAVQALLASAGSGDAPVPIDLGSLDQAMAATIQSRIQEGLLPGIEVTTDSPQLLVAYAGGIGLMDATRVTITSDIYTAAPATAIAVNTNTDQASYAAAGDGIVLLRLDRANGSALVDGNQPLKKMPGPITKLAFDDATKILHALGKTPDGKGWTLYAVEINANAVFSDAVLPGGEPVAIALDSAPELPGFDRHEMLVFGPDGSMAAVDVGQFAFSWRIVPVLFGVLMAVCLYLLARLLFRRRSVGLLVALFVALDGMLFVQSRIAMNDAFVGASLLLAYLIFAVMWLNGDSGSRRSWAVFWVGMPLLGLTLGLALSAKWVAMYAIASIGLLILTRSALGRVIALLALSAATGILGWIAIASMHYAKGKGDLAGFLLALAAALVVAGAGAYLVAYRARTGPDKCLFGILTIVVTGFFLALSLWAYPPSDQNGSPNYTFFLILLTATMIAAWASAYRPVAWTRQEMWFAVAIGLAVSAACGALLAGVALPLIGGLRGHQMLPWAALGGLAIGPLFWAAGRAGLGPLADPPPPGHPMSLAEPPSPAPRGWLRLGSGFGLPAVWMALCLLVLPIAVYMASYIPWAMPWQPETAETGSLPILYCFETGEAGQCLRAWPDGHTGQTLRALTEGMYNYHNELRAEHAASSPWWAWPLDLKPVWFHSDHYALSQGSMIYDGGNPVTWWMALFAMAFVCWQAFKRRSLGLMLIGVAFAFQWLAWARIDRAAFQYHFYTALPFYLLGLAYFISELWHGPSRRTWLLARVAGVALLLFPSLLWLAKSPLCSLARVDMSNGWGPAACQATEGYVVVETRMFLIVLVLVVALAVLALALSYLERAAEEEGEVDRMWAVWLLTPVVIAGALLLAIGAYGPRTTLFEFPVSAGGGLVTIGVPLAFGVLGAILGALLLAARDARRVVAAYCVLAILGFILLYPNLSALRMPDHLVSAYNGFLPTWLYGFQFSVNMQQGTGVAPTSREGLLVAAFVAALALVFAYAAWTRRLADGDGRKRELEAGIGIGEGEGAGGRSRAGGETF